MRINHKYLRNKHFKQKHFKRAKNFFDPYRVWHTSYASMSEAEQIAEGFRLIYLLARAFESGAPYSLTLRNSPSWFRREINRLHKSKINVMMAKINAGDYELDEQIPRYKYNAGYDYW